MAKLIPSLNSCLRRMQAGEKRFARRIEQLLEDDYLCWFEMPVGKRQRYTDFIILHPLRGLLLLEVKDWKIDTIQSINKKTFTINTNSGQKTVTNPLEQARQCSYQLVNELAKDPQLINKDGDNKGKLITPYGYGVVLSNITLKQFNDTNLGDVLPSHQVICKDEMTENSDAEEFQKLLWNMFIYQFKKPLTVPQIDRIRWHIFPEIRINTGIQDDLFANTISNKPSKKEKIIPEIIKVMDMQQEQLARSIGNGHRVIHGVAGSGKTLILGYRSLYLAQTIEKPILVLCFNITLSAQLRQIMVSHDIADKVNVYHFHDWCGEQLTRYHIDKPSVGPNYVNGLVEKVIQATEAGSIPKDQYGAIMIDEGHDFQPEWLKLISSMVNPDTDSLLLLYDDAQSIYKKKNLDFSLSSVDIQARGRTTILRVNYRNTDEIIKFAYRFASYHFKAEESDEDHVPLIEPTSAGRKGKEPAVMVLEDHDQEIRYIIHAFKILNSKYSIPWMDMCVTCHSKWIGQKLQLAFVNAGIPSKWLGTKKMKKAYNPNDDSVTIMTIYSSKGLEFPVVAVSGVGFMPRKNHNKISEAKLLYVALTRSTEKLLVTSHVENEFTKELGYKSKEVENTEI
ncbi:nuclease-related domain-containing DEAD/DEAH box helicase [Cocleimonas flava]|uniref:DNA 3'-5' helicase n=1 Tax=Cocleimonas flava TaxID=634765 RepID=A0A4R1F2S9_9GAMM|nr:3'-5' exonuclease [Cocleimonas flava]TCJ88486.1 AAA domain-containing protein [Cocleimonas flava]